MVKDADQMKADLMEQNEVEGPMFKMEDDPRVTKIGKFIRKHSIDEFPQFLNVLLGDMSVVGPRPPLPDEVDQYDEWAMQRLAAVSYTHLVVLHIIRRMRRIGFPGRRICLNRKAS